MAKHYNSFEIILNWGRAYYLIYKIRIEPCSWSWARLGEAEKIFSCNFAKSEVAEVLDVKYAAPSKALQNGRIEITHAMTDYRISGDGSYVFGYS